MKDNRGTSDSSVSARTALLGVLIGVVATVVLAVALPGQRFTQSVVTLELVRRTVTFSCEKNV